MKIMPNRMDRGFYRYQKEFEEKALEVLRSGWYVLGKEVQAFEEEFAAYTGAQHCVSVANGLDALILAFRVLGIKAGDEVLVQGNTYIASVMGITINGATPIFVEPDEYFGIDVTKLEAKLTSRTKAVLAVHLYGQAEDMSELVAFCHKHNLKLVEDCAQSHGAMYQDKMTGTFGDIGCFSFYPSKNLGAFGDGGAIVTNQKTIADEIKILRNYGSEKRYYNQVIGTNSRLDEIQAGLLRVRLKYLDELNLEKQQIAKQYLDRIQNPKLILPKLKKEANHVWHQFVIRCKERDALVAYLDEREIGTIIHYPIPPHLAQGYKDLGYKEGDFPITEALAKEVLSIPMYNGMTQDEIEQVIVALNNF